MHYNQKISEEIDKLHFLNAYKKYIEKIKISIDREKYHLLHNIITYLFYILLYYVKLC